MDSDFDITLNDTLLRGVVDAAAELTDTATLTVNRDVLQLQAANSICVLDAELRLQQQQKPQQKPQKPHNISVKLPLLRQVLRLGPAGSLRVRKPCGEQALELSSDVSGRALECRVTGTEAHGHLDTSGWRGHLGVAIAARQLAALVRDLSSLAPYVIVRPDVNMAAARVVLRVVASLAQPVVSLGARVVHGGADESAAFPEGVQLCLTQLVKVMKAASTCDGDEVVLDFVDQCSPLALEFRLASSAGPSTMRYYLAPMDAASASNSS